MVSRGRKSAAEKSAFATMSMFERGVRPAPPKNLSPAEAQVWKNIAASLPPEWFPVETHPLLEQYCKHVAGLPFFDKVLADIEKAHKPDLDKWQKVTALRQAESKTIAMLAVKMRLAQQSSYDKEKARTTKEHSARTPPTFEDFEIPDAPANPWG